MVKFRVLIAVLGLLLVTAVPIVHSSPNISVPLMEVCVNGKTVETYAYPSQVILWKTQKNTKTDQVEISLIIESSGENEVVLKAWTCLRYPIFSGDSQEGAIGFQYRNTWTAETRLNRIALDLSGAIDWKQITEGDIIFRLIYEPEQVQQPLLDLSVSFQEKENEKPLSQPVSTIKDILIGQYAIVFYPALLALVFSTIVVRRKLQWKIREK